MLIFDMSPIERSLSVLGAIQVGKPQITEPGSIYLIPDPIPFSPSRVLSQIEVLDGKHLRLTYEISTDPVTGERLSESFEIGPEDYSRREIFFRTRIPFIAQNFRWKP